jgi:hypothetical protein
MESPRRTMACTHRGLFRFCVITANSDLTAYLFRDEAPVMTSSERVASKEKIMVMTPSDRVAFERENRGPGADIMQPPSLHAHQNSLIPHYKNLNSSSE